MNCQYSPCGKHIPRDKHGEDRYKLRRYCSRECNRSDITAKRRAEADLRLARIEDLLAAGLSPEDVIMDVGGNRKSLLAYCAHWGRKDLAVRLFKHPGTKAPNRRSHIDHGTAAGYQAHREQGDLPACQPCIRAHSTANAVREAVRAARTGGGPTQIDNPTAEDWDQAACRTVGEPDDWYPRPREWARGARAQIACLTACPLRRACLQMALEADGDWARWGIWGGMTASERARLKARAA